MNQLPHLSIDLCHARQNRLRMAMDALGAYRLLLTSRENIHWLTGYWHHPLMNAAAILDVEGGCTLYAPNAEPNHHAASKVVVFEASLLCTLRQDQISLIAATLDKPNAIDSTEHSSCPTLYREIIGPKPINLDKDLLRLRRKKDLDEIGLLKHAINCTHAMYLKAREIITPGLTELEVFAQLQMAGVTAAGEALTACGNDYQSNSPGGPPRNRPLGAGELMILDLGPAYRGYHADNCRTFAVNQSPDDEQLKAFEVIKSAFKVIEHQVRPGISCRGLYHEVKSILDGYQKGAFFHHLGHGIGLYPHESPHLNPNWDECFEVGDVFAAEPGIYTNTLRAGIRIEENYLVTEDGLEKLTKTCIEL